MTDTDFATALQVSVLDVLSDRPRAKAAPPPQPAPVPAAPPTQAEVAAPLTQAEVDEIMSYIPPELRQASSEPPAPSNFHTAPSPAAELLVSSLSAFLADGARHLDTPTPASTPVASSLSNFLSDGTRYLNGAASAPRQPELAYAPAPSYEAPYGTEASRDASPHRSLPAAPSVAAASKIQGFVAACLVDGESGLMLASEGGGQIDMEAAAALNSEVMKAQRKAMAIMRLDDHLEDILVTLGRQLHFLRPLKSNPDMFVYVALDKKTANLGMARMQINRLEATLGT